MFAIADVTNVALCKHCFNNQWPTSFNWLSNKGTRDILYFTSAVCFYARRYFFPYLCAAMYFLYQSASTHFPCVIHLQLLCNWILFYWVSEMFLVCTCKASHWNHICTLPVWFYTIYVMYSFVFGLFLKGIVDPQLFLYKYIEGLLCKISFDNPDIF